MRRYKLVHACKRLSTKSVLDALSMAKVGQKAQVIFIQSEGSISQVTRIIIFAGR